MRFAVVRSDARRAKMVSFTTEAQRTRKTKSTNCSYRIGGESVAEIHYVGSIKQTVHGPQCGTLVMTKLLNSEAEVEIRHRQPYFLALAPLMFQIPSQYWRIERSEENLPMRAAFRIDIRDHFS